MVIIIDSIVMITVMIGMTMAMTSLTVGIRTVGIRTVGIRTAGTAMEDGTSLLLVLVSLQFVCSFFLISKVCVSYYTLYFIPFFSHLFHLVCYPYISAMLPTDSPTWNDDEWGKDGWDKDGWDGDGGWDKDTADPTAEPTWKGDGGWDKDGWDKDGWDKDGWGDGGGNKVSVVYSLNHHTSISFIDIYSYHLFLLMI